MPLEKEDLDQITQIVSGIVSPLKDELTNGFNTSLTGAVQKVRKELKSDIDAVSGSYDGINDTVRKTVETLFSEALKPKEATPTTSETTQLQSSQATEQQNGLADVLAKIQSLEAENETLKGNFTKAQQLAEQERRNAQETQVKANFCNAVRDRISHPDQFLLALQSFGGVQLKDGSLVVESKDDWGNVNTIPVLQKDGSGNDMIDLFTKDPQFSIYAVQRPGGSPSAKPGTTPTGATAQPKFFKENSSPEDIAKAMLENGMDSVLADLEKKVS